MTLPLLPAAKGWLRPGPAAVLPRAARPSAIRIVEPFGRLVRRSSGMGEPPGVELCPEAEPAVDPPSVAPHTTEVLFVEVGFGSDQHGQDATKAATRACRNAIEFNSIPSIRRLVPGGYEGLRLHVKIGTPHPETVDLEAVRRVFPYGKIKFEVVEGGLSCSSGIAIPEMGDTSDEMIIACAAVTVGHAGEPKIVPATKGYNDDPDDF